MRKTMNVRSWESPPFSSAANKDELSEKGFVALYIELTGSRETEARGVYMYSGVIRQRTSVSWED